MTLKELHFFYNLCENPQVTNVAKKLNISQSAVSLAIKSLEEKLHETLFDRIGKKLILNERGRFFKEQTYSHYLALKEAQLLFQNKKIAGRLNIAASKTISNFIMPNIYYNFLKQNPEVKFNIDSVNSSQIIEKIVQGEIDLGLIETNLEHSNIIKESLCEDELIIVSTTAYDCKEKFIDTLPQKWILREVGSGTREVFTQALGEMAKELDIFMELHSFHEIKTILLTHPNSITAISKHAVKQELQKKQLFEIKLKNIEFKRTFSLIYHKDKTPTLLFTTFKEFLKEQLFTQNNNYE
ncbi:MAG: LysR family transcriptional regulator [Arcobacteraceae bacterium]